MKGRNILLVLPVASFLWFTSVLIWGGITYENYNHASQFISELGATGAPHGSLINYLGFIPAEILILVFVYLSFSVPPTSAKNKTGLILIAVYAISLCAAAVFPCDFGCRPETPTLSHMIHISSAIPAYLSGITAIFLISSGSENWCGSNTLKIAGYILGLIAVLAFFNLDEASDLVGAFQRLLEASIYIWLIMLGYNLRKSPVPN